MSECRPRVLLIGFGNPGRLDDGLGPALAEAIERLAWPGVTVESNYQLTVEDAAMVAAHDVVIFADAAVDGEEPFTFRQIEPKRNEANECGGGEIRYTSHHLDPEDVVELACRLFGSEARCYVLAIRGYEFNEFGERLSAGAGANLAKAIEFLDAVVHMRSAARPADVDGRFTTRMTSRQGA